MKLNRGKLGAAVAVVVAMLGIGAVTVVGVDRAADTTDPQVVAEMAATEQDTTVDGDTPATADTNPGVEQYRGGGSHGGASHAGTTHGGASHAGASHAGGARGGHEGGFARGGREGGYGRGGYGDRGRWGGSSRWGRWGGGRYVGGRWVDGPYYGWCDARYYDCNRAWY